jgi:glucose/arabinose dehydrogenase
MARPASFWEAAIAPSGMAFYGGEMFPEWQGSLLIGAPNPGGLVRLTLDGDRVRGVAVAPDGAQMRLIEDAEGAVLRVARGG